MKTAKLTIKKIGFYATPANLILTSKMTNKYWSLDYIKKLVVFSYVDRVVIDVQINELEVKKIIVTKVASNNFRITTENHNSLFCLNIDCSRNEIYDYVVKILRQERKTMVTNKVYWWITEKVSMYNPSVINILTDGKIKVIIEYNNVVVEYLNNRSGIYASADYSKATETVALYNKQSLLIKYDTDCSESKIKNILKLAAKIANLQS